MLHRLLINTSRMRTSADRLGLLKLLTNRRFSTSSTASDLLLDDFGDENESKHKKKVKKVYEAQDLSKYNPRTNQEPSNLYLEELDEFGRAYATGRRKTSVARVWLSEGSGCFVVNEKDLCDYFQPMFRTNILEPLILTGTSGYYDVMCTVKGGGMTGQAGAIQLGLSRAIVKMNQLFRPDLASEGFLTRDSRRVERKKPGQKKARKKFQWVKR